MNQNKIQIGKIWIDLKKVDMFSYDSLNVSISIHGHTYNFNYSDEFTKLDAENIHTKWRMVV